MYRPSAVASSAEHEEVAADGAEEGEAAQLLAGNGVVVDACVRVVWTWLRRWKDAARWEIELGSRPATVSW